MCVNRRDSDCVQITLLPPLPSNVFVGQKMETREGEGEGGIMENRFKETVMRYAFPAFYSITKSEGGMGCVH